MEKPPRGGSRLRPWRRGLPWFVAAILLATIGAPSVAALGSIPSTPLIGYAHPAAGNATLLVNMTDQPAFAPRYLSASAGENVSVQLENLGSFTHTFTLAATPGAFLGSNLTPAGVYAFFAANGTLANVSVAPGASGWANFTLNASLGLASFEFASVVPFQFQAGMWGLLNVTTTGPGLVMSENTTDALRFIPNELAAFPAHYPLVLNVLVTNQGSFGHTFTLASQSNVTLSPANFTAYFSAHAPVVDAVVPSGGGSTVWANFTIAGPGVYEYICTVPGHFANGMYGYLYIGVAVPTPPPPPSTAIVASWVLVGSGILLGIGVLVAVVASYTGRFPRSPPGHGHH